MNGKWLPITAAVLIVAGLLGIAVLAVAQRGWDGACPLCGVAPGGRGGGGRDSATPRERTPQQFLELGERIYTQGRGDGGRSLSPRSGRGMMGRSCDDCHGADGKGLEIGMMMGSITTPDIRYSTLTSRRTEGTETVEPWTDGDIARAVREGVEPDGERLAPTMPPWELTDAEMEALLTYLRRL